MDLRGRIEAVLADDAWRYPIAAGLFALLLKVWDAWPAVYELDPPVFFAAALAAYLYHGRGDVDHERIGRRAALVASLPVLWTVGEIAAFPFLATTSPLWFRVVAPTLFLAMFVVFWYAIAVVLVGTLGAKVGHWIAENFDLPQPEVGNPVRRSS